MIEIILLIILIVLVLVLIFKKNNSNSNTADVEKFSGMIEGQLKTQPDLVASKIGENLHKIFGDFKDNIFNNNQEQIKQFGEFKNNLTQSLADNSAKITKDLIEFKDGFKKDLTIDFEKLNKTVEDRLDKISNKVMENLDEGFKKTNKTFNDVIESIAKIEKAQENMNKLSTEIVDFKDILKDKKTRGLFGEGQLNHILQNIFGEGNKGKLYDLQYQLKNGKQVDAIILMPEGLDNISVDSKFPLESYRKLTDTTLSDIDIKEAEKRFKLDVKEHIKTISEKYIIPGETAELALMFLPAESVYLEIIVHHQDLVDFAHSRKVMLSAPNNLVALLTTVRNAYVDQERKKYAHVIQEQLVKLSKDFGSYRKRWDGLKKHMDTVSKDVNEIHITTSKISNKFEKISGVELEDHSKDDSPLLLEND